MKKIGLVGGLAWVSTVDYYSEINRADQHESGGTDSQPNQRPLEMCIESLSLRTALSYIGTEGDERSWTRFDEYHRSALQRLERSGAECAAIASNTPHSRFESIVRGINIPVIDMFDVVAREAARRTMSEVLVLGTPATMASSRFREVLRRHGLRALEVSDRAAVSRVFALIERLQHHSIEGMAKELEEIVRGLWSGQSLAQPCVLLACTELPLAFQEDARSAMFESEGIVYINSTAVHIRAIVECAREE